MSPEARYEFLMADACSTYGLSVEPKTSKWYWRTVGTLLTVLSFGNLDFMGKFNTTFGNRIGVTPNWDRLTVGQKYVTLLHEVEHMKQYKTAGMGNIWLGFIICSVGYLLVPFPIGIAYVRARMEMGGYAQTIRAIIQLYGVDAAKRQKWFILSQFYGINYFFMWPFKKYMENWFDKTLARIVVEEGTK